MPARRRGATASTQLVLLLAIDVLVGCGSQSVAGIAKTDGPVDVPADVAKTCIEPEPTFAQVQNLFDQNCSGCHAAGADLDLSPGRSYVNLVGRPAPSSESCGGVLVIPGSPDTSYLFIKLSAAHPCAGEQMPRTDIYPVPLPQCLQHLVRDWIMAGALPGTNGPDQGPSGDAGSDDGGQ